MTPSKTVSIEFPGMEGFEVDLCYLAREELIKLRKRTITTKFNRRTHQPEEVLDEDKFLTEYTAAVIKGWKGLDIILRRASISGYRVTRLESGTSLLCRRGRNIDEEFKHI